MPEIVKTSERLAYLQRRVEELEARMTQLGELEARVVQLEAARKPARSTTPKT